MGLLCLPVQRDGWEEVCGMKGKSDSQLLAAGAKAAELDGGGEKQW